MTRLFLAAGVAALAIATPAAAKPGGGGGGHGGGNGQPAAQPHGNGGGNGGGHGGGAPAAMGGGGGGHGHGGGGAPVSMGGGGHGHGGGGFAAPQMRQQPKQFRGPQMRAERQQFRAPQVQRQQGHAMQHQQARGMERKQARAVERQQARNVQHQQMRGIERQQARAMERQQQHANRNLQAQTRGFERQQQGGKAMRQVQQQAFAGQQYNAPQFSRDFGGKGAKLVRNQQQQAFQQQLDASRFGALNYGAGTQILAPAIVETFVGVPLANVAGFAGLSPMPASLQYLYPATPDYYYQYGDGYAYQVNRGTNLIDALIPLLAGGYLPGQYLPATYMQSYVPEYWGLNSFYPDSNYGCNRYYNGVIYQVDCASGYVEDVVPMYAGGYGVGQMLPSAYNYYNVPMQYRELYYDTPDYGYWYSPGAIYQYDQGSNVITSVAALMSPGFAIGQPLPVGYDVYNVPYDYRATYYDTPNAWYRYNNGYVYQVDPTTQLVTAIVASLLS